MEVDDSDDVPFEFWWFFRSQALIFRGEKLCSKKKMKQIHFLQLRQKQKEKEERQREENRKKDTWHWLLVLAYGSEILPK